MSIEVKDITKLYGKQKAVDSVSFSVKTGEVVGLLGPNGAGKSTLMKILTCFIPATTGNANVCGYDVMDESIKVRKKIGYLPENNPLYLEMYVREYLAFHARIFGLGAKRKELVDEMIEITGLQVEQNKKIAALSKGYRQRVGLAQALMHDPEVLIMDEPTSGLDPNQLIEIRQLITKVGEKKTVLLSTHIMQEVEAICNRVIIINKGQIVADKSIKDLDKIQNNFQVLFVEFNQPISKKQLQEIPDVKEIKEISQSSFHLVFDPEKDIRPAVFDFAVRKKIAVLSQNIIKNNMERVFQSLTSNKENNNN